MRVRKQSIGIGFLLIFLLFKPALEFNTSSIFQLIISYSDEFLTILAVFYILYNFLLGRKIPKFLGSAIIAWIALMVVGLISTLINMVQPWKSSLVDMISCSKFFSFYIASAIFWNNNFQNDWFLRFNKLIKFLISVIVILLLFNIFVYQIFPTSSYRWIVNSQQLFFGHPSNLADFALICFVILLINYSPKNKYNLLYMILATIIVIFTMRNKQIAAIAFGWLAFIYFYILKLHFTWPLILLASLSSIYVGYDSLILYYGSYDTETARGMMSRIGVIIANQKFPLGYGFGTFGSGASLTPYSDIYYKYGLSNVFGLTPDSPDFANDAFWPVVFGQFGWLGFIIIIYFFVSLFKECFNIKKDILSFCGSLTLLAYIIIATFGTTSIFNESFMLIAAIISYAFVSANIEGERNE